MCARHRRSYGVSILVAYWTLARLDLPRAAASRAQQQGVQENYETLLVRTCRVQSRLALARKRSFAMLRVLALCAIAHAAQWTDCDDFVSLATNGSWETGFTSARWDNSLFYSVFPEGDGGPFPVIAYMHGSTGTWRMYDDALRRFSSQGCVVVRRA